MKIVVGIVASREKEYQHFRENWDQIIAELDIPEFQFFFIYGSGRQSENEHEWCCDIPDSIDTMLDKTHLFMNWALQNLDFDYLLRTNLSTLFDFGRVLKWIGESGIPKSEFIGGSWIGGGQMISGTNMLMSRDIVEYIAHTPLEKFPRTHLGDIELCKMGLQHARYTINIKRIDFISTNNKNTILYHKCRPSDRDIFCFRFKTNQRNYDVILMNLLYTHFHTLGLDHNNFIETRVNDFHITSEYEHVGDHYSNRIVELNHN